MGVLMKNAVIGLAAVFSLGMVSVAGATPFSNVFDFDSSGTYLDQSYSLISDSNSTTYFGEYTHNVTFSPDALSVESAFLTIDYARLTNHLSGKSSKEIFLFSESGGPAPLGDLKGFDDDLWHSMEFDLADHIAVISGANWSIGFNFKESTNGTDTFHLDKSTLWGEYTVATDGVVGIDATVVPEPSTFILLGGGLAGLAFVVRRRRKE
jgi:hypothetical protein